MTKQNWTKDYEPRMFETDELKKRYNLYDDDLTVELKDYDYGLQNNEYIVRIELYEGDENFVEGVLEDFIFSNTRQIKLLKNLGVPVKIYISSPQFETEVYVDELVDIDKIEMEPYTNITNDVNKACLELKKHYPEYDVFVESYEDDAIIITDKRSFGYHFYISSSNIAVTDDTGDASIIEQVKAPKGKTYFDNVPLIVDTIIKLMNKYTSKQNKLSSSKEIRNMKAIKSADKHFNYDEYLGDIYDSDGSNADYWSREEYNEMVETARGIFYPAVQKAANACHFTVSDNEAEYVAEKCVRYFFDNASWDEAVNRPEEYYVNSSRKPIKSSLEDRLVPYLEEFEEGFADTQVVAPGDEMDIPSRQETFFEIFKNDHNLTDEDINKLKDAVMDIWEATAGE